MKIIIYQNREVYKEDSKIGNDSENKVETLEFEFPKEYNDFTKYIEFQIKGGKYVDLIDNNKYVITREVAKYGKIKTQVVLKKNTENDVIIFKSDIFTLNVSNSINATENLVDTVGIDLIEKIVTKNSEQDTRLDVLEVDNATNKTNIQNIKEEQIKQNTNISNLQLDNTSNKDKIEEIETKKKEQDNEISEINQKNQEQDIIIQRNTAEIAKINEKDIKQDELIEGLENEVIELQAENTALKNQIPTGEATGNPIQISDSSDLPCEIVPVGNVEQATRDGYNLINSAKFVPKTSNGMEGTINIDGSIKFKGMTTDTTNFWFNDLNTNLKAGTYIFITNIDLTSKGRYTLMDSTSGSNVNIMNGTKTNTFTITNDMTLSTMLIQLNSGITLNDDFYIMLVEGNIEKTYEQFGASPSPDHPSKIVTVGNNENLLDLANSDLKTYSGVSYLVQDGEIVFNGTATQNLTLFFPNKLNIEAKEYTLSITKTGKISGSIGYYIYPNEGNAILDGGNLVTASDFTYKSKTFDSEYKNCNFGMFISSGSNLNDFRVKPKLEKGGVATPHSPHGLGSVGINVSNSNMIDLHEGSYTMSQLDIVVDTSKMKVKGTTSSDCNLFETYGALYKFIYLGKFKAGKYIFGINISGTTPTSSCWAFYLRKPDKTAVCTLDFSHRVRGFTLSEDTEIYIQGFDNAAGHVWDAEIELQLNMGTEVMEWAQHEGYKKSLPMQKEFLEKGEYKDTFIKQIGKWYEKHYNPKVIFDGTESWNTSQSTDKMIRFQTAVLPSICGATNLGYSNYFKVQSEESSKINSGISVYTGTSSVYIWISKTIAETVEDFKAWLAEQYAKGTPVVLYYVSETPELIECTAEQEKRLNSFKTYKNVTHISADGIATLNVKYKKDLETLNKNNEARIAALEAALVS